MKRLKFKTFTISVFALFCSLSHWPAYAAESEAALPTFLNAYEPVDIDERGFWQKWDEEEKKFARSPIVYDAPKLVDYLKGVLCKTVGEVRCNATRIYVVRDTYFNASMAPNGVMSVHTGLLLRMRNEAELASILGHEFAHFEKRHTLNSFKKRRRGQDVVNWMALAAGAAASYSAAGSSLQWRDFRTNIYGGIYRYDRNQERESDILGATYLTTSRYSNRAAANVWLRQIDEDAEQARERKRSKRKKATGWLDSHPSAHERSEYLSRLSDEVNDEGELFVQPYIDAIRPYLNDFFDDQLNRNDFAASKFILDEMAYNGWTSDLLFLKGELYRSRGNPRDLVTSLSAYSSAIAEGYSEPSVWRGLGLSQMRTGAIDDGKQSLQTYLELEPSAPDAAMMKAMIEG